MNHEISLISLRLIAIGALISLPITVSAPTRSLAQEAKSASETDRAERRTEMQQLVQPMRAVGLNEATRIPLDLKAEPLHRWNDPTREFSDGSLYLWTNHGRPHAAIAVELYPVRTGGQAWSFELVSLSTGLVEVDGGPGFDIKSDDFERLRDDMVLNWAPKTPGIEFKEVPGATGPAATEPARLRQMKAFADRFSADEFYEPSNQTYRLRLLPRHVHRYADAGSDILDGAVFLIAHGTNPEIFLLLEAQGKTAETARWRYALARLSMAAPTVRIDQNVVWTQPLAKNLTPSDTYFIVRKPRKPASATPATPEPRKVKP